MRGINISNEKKRDALGAFETSVRKSKITMVLPGGEARSNVRFLKSLGGFETLLKKYGDPLTVGKAIIETDDDIDIEIAGKLLGKTSKLYRTNKGEIAYTVNLVQVVRNPDGSEKERRELSKTLANIAVEIPLQWTGRKFPIDEAVRKFVFTRSYQLYHTNGLSNDFLYGMAKQLHEEKALMFIGAGKKGNEPIVVSAGGEPYRGFLEGRVEGQKYMLALHLTNMELKPLSTEKPEEKGAAK